MQLDLGRFDEAGESAALVVRDLGTPPVARSWSLPTLGFLRARRGDAEASGPLEEADALVHTTGELMRIGPVAAASAGAAWLTGDNAGVERVSEAALSLALHRRAAWVAGELAYWRWQASLRSLTACRSPASGHAPRSFGGGSAVRTKRHSRWRKATINLPCASQSIS